MKTKFTTSLIAIAGLLSNASAVTWDFTSPDFSTGSLAGQQGFGSFDGTFSVDTSGSGTLDAGDAAGASIFREQSDADLGATFDNSSSIVTYAFDINTAASAGGFTPNFELYLGGYGFSGSTADVLLYVRQDTIISYNNGGFVGGSAALTESASNTIVATLNYASDTFSVTVNGGAYLTDVAMNPGGSQENRIRFRNNGYDTLSFNSVSITAVPEPSSYALISGAFALGWIMVRRRK